MRAERFSNPRLPGGSDSDSLNAASLRRRAAVDLSAACTQKAALDEISEERAASRSVARSACPDAV
jgi:hypothetical protein